MNNEQLVGWAEPFRALVERAGAELVGVKDGEILFRANADSPICKLYPYAIRSVVDIQLALKNAREKQMASAWELTEPAVKQRGMDG
jgi:hypothetical protein